MIIFDSRVISVIAQHEDAIVDQQMDIFSSEFSAEAHVIVVLVNSKNPQVAYVLQGDLRSDLRAV
jgi:hypothetical protein